MSVDTDTWWNAFTENMPSMDGSSSSANMTWALQQHCQTALDKLILLRVCDGAGSSGVAKGSVSALAVFACCEEAEARDALMSLCQSDFLVILEEGDSYTVALPWWKPGCRPSERRANAGASRQQFKADLRSGLIEMQCGRCWYCGGSIVGKVRTPHVDHQHPRIRGGSDDIENLVMACAPCNIRKNDRTVDEYRAYLIARDGFEADFLFYMEQPK